MMDGGGLSSELYRQQSRRRLLRSGKSHPRQPLLEPLIAAQTVPLRRHRQMHERRVTAVERAIEAAESVVKIAGLGLQHREPDVGAAAGVLCLLPGGIES